REPSFLWDAVWGYEHDAWQHILMVTLSSLRKKLGPKWGPRLQAHRGRGYLLVEG
ncbi:MAG: helix-turn-helix domain-containing protein, partial [Elusimicrobia bacterium]|nr:helix-turn-helix domain-containing protein [Elusimicrobiota bacterium]